MPLGKFQEYGAMARAKRDDDDDDDIPPRVGRSPWSWCVALCEKLEAAVGADGSVM
jgi:hypothetical protein